jgi:hypothetical protein
MTADETRYIFVMMMQGPAADRMTSRLQGNYTIPPFEALKESLKENCFKTEELKWEEASALWHEEQFPEERILDYVVRMKN